MILCNRIGPMSGAVKVGRCPSDLRELVHPQLHWPARASKQRIGRELSAASPGQSSPWSLVPERTMRNSGLRCGLVGEEGLEPSKPYGG